MIDRKKIPFYNLCDNTWHYYMSQRYQLVKTRLVIHMVYQTNRGDMSFDSFY